MISKDEMLQEEFYLNLQNTLDKFEKILLKDGYIIKDDGLFYRSYNYISDDYSYRSIIQVQIMNYYPNRSELNKNWPYLDLTQIESDLDNDEIFISDGYTTDYDNEKTVKEIEKELIEIDKSAEIEIAKHLDLPTIYIRKGYKYEDKDSIGAKKIETDILYTDKFNEAGFQYGQPSKSYVITSILHSNISLHELIKELNTGDLINLYKKMNTEED
ncbi:MAG: hypothetical protein M0R80_04190 [Proteobacteria bacterium]|jgi:hypothetical protein|nr:hypothetical protein [Pseudomonadota bacterium]